MKATCTIQLVLIFTLALTACTDKRTPLHTQGSRLSRAVAQTLTKVGDLRGTSANGSAVDISTYQMFGKGSNIYLTGAGNGAPALGFSRWNITADKERPSVVFSVAEQLDSFTEKTTKNWSPAFYAAGALSIVGNWAYMSGSAGMSVVDMSDIHPKEAVRFPASPDIQINRDENYVYKAIVAHPTLPLLYGFREQDYQYTLSASGANVKILGKNPYAGTGETVCCVMGATVFQNQVYVAFTHALWIFKFGPKGELAELTIDDNFQATGITSTGDKLYIMHQPAKAPKVGGENNPAGIYVFDSSGNEANYLAIQPSVFAVSSDNSHLYANMDETSVTIYRINWNQASQ